MEHTYSNTCDEHVFKKTGKTIDDWIVILDRFRALEKSSNTVVLHLHYTYRLQGYRAEALKNYYISYKKRINRKYESK